MVDQYAEQAEKYRAFERKEAREAIQKQEEEKLNPKPKVEEEKKVVLSPDD